MIALLKAIVRSDRSAKPSPFTSLTIYPVRKSFASLEMIVTSVRSIKPS
ncbi:MAG: hypothetical protein R3A12_03490 [Ignavibacteria bacterium]